MKQEHPGKRARVRPEAGTAVAKADMKASEFMAALAADIDYEPDGESMAVSGLYDAIATRLKQRQGDVADSDALGKLCIVVDDMAGEGMAWETSTSTDNVEGRVRSMLHEAFMAKGELSQMRAQFDKESGALRAQIDNLQEGRDRDHEALRKIIVDQLGLVGTTAGPSDVIAAVQEMAHALTTAQQHVASLEGNQKPEGFEAHLNTLLQTLKTYESTFDIIKNATQLAEAAKHK